MIGFVDDTSGSTNDFLQDASIQSQHYLQLAEEDAQRWNDVLHTSGAALNDLKCSYHFLHFDFSLSGIAFARGSLADPVISIRYNASSNKTRLKPIGNYSPHKTLGTWKAPAGEDVIGSKKLKEKNSHHTKVITNSPFDCRDAWAYYHSVYLPSITYVLPSTNILKKTLLSMQHEIKVALLPKCGYNRNTPSAVVYGSNVDAGIGLRDLVVEKA